MPDGNRLYRGRGLAAATASSGGNGTMHRRLPATLTCELAAGPTGLLADVGFESVFVVAPDGRRRMRVAGGRKRSGFDGDGDSATDVALGRSRKVDVSGCRRRGLLIADYAAIRYVPPEHPGMLARRHHPADA